MVNERRWLVLIFTLYFLLAVGYSLLMPIWEAPDEGAHYHLAWYLTTGGRYASYKANYEALQPRLYYYFSAGILHALGKVNPEFIIYYFPKEYKYNIRIPERRFEWTDETYRFLVGAYVLRWINIIFGGIALWLNWKTFKFIVPEKTTLCLAAFGLAALTPQYLHIMSSVNNDSVGTLAGALLFYLTIRSLKESSILWSVMTILLAIVLPFITKLTVLPVSAAVLVIIAWKWIFKFTQKRWLMVSILLLFVSVVTLYLLFPEIVQTALSEIKWRLLSFRKKGITDEYIKVITSQILATYWGKVGWLAVGLPSWIINGLTALGLIGMTLQGYALAKAKVNRQQLSLWVGTWLIAIFTILAVFRNGLTTGATQGRLLFPAIGALSLLMVAGWHEVLPEQIQRYFPAFVISLFLFCNMLLWLTGVLPVYYQPFLD